MSEIVNEKVIRVTNNIEYERRSNEVIITGYLGDETAIILPDVIDRLPVTIIGEKAFHSKTKIASIKIGCHVKDIQRFAFSICRNLKSIMLPNGLENIGPGAFSHCSSIETIIIPKSVKNIGSASFGDCSSLKSITIPIGINSIERSTFGGCKSLVSITIPNSVVKIGSLAFSSCRSLSKITIPESVVEISYDAFSGAKLSDINVSSNNKYFSSTDGVLFNKDGSILIKVPERYANYSNEIVYHIPTNVIQINNAAFSSLNYVSCIMIPQSVKRIEDLAFNHSCHALSSINVNINNEYFSSIDGVLFNKAQTHLIRYPEFKNEDEYIIPQTVIRIGKKAFVYGRLKSVIIPEGVKIIENNAIDGSISLTIYAEVESQPQEWDSFWKNSSCSVVWGSKRYLDNNDKNHSQLIKDDMFNHSGENDHLNSSNQSVCSDKTIDYFINNKTYKKAIDCLAECIEKDEFNKYTFIKLARVLMLDKHTETAIETLHIASKIISEKYNQLINVYNSGNANDFEKQTFYQMTIKLIAYDEISDIASNKNYNFGDVSLFLEEDILFEYFMIDLIQNKETSGYDDVYYEVALLNFTNKQILDDLRKQFLDSRARVVYWEKLCDNVHKHYAK